jgi:G3E family GTPase
LNSNEQCTVPVTANRLTIMNSPSASGSGLQVSIVLVSGQSDEFLQRLVAENNDARTGFLLSASNSGTTNASTKTLPAPSGPSGHFPGDALVAAIAHEVNSGAWNRLIVEVPAGWEPGMIAALFEEGCSRDHALNERTLVESLITVARPEDFDRAGTCRSELLARQVEFATQIVVTGAATSPEMNPHLRTLRLLNPHALVLSADSFFSGHRSIAPGFRTWMKQGGQGWFQALAGRYPGPEGLLFRARTPFHPGRLWAALQGPLKNLQRIRGIFWIASRPRDVGSLDWVSGEGTCAFNGTWWAAKERSEWPDNPTFRASIAARWAEPFGDRIQEIALLDLQQSLSAVEKTLEKCLLTTDELAPGEASWTAWEDPFPAEK